MIQKHSVHDYQELFLSWQKVIKKSTLRMKELTQYDNLPVWEISNHWEMNGVQGLYISAGIHGDEPASCWALLGWVEKNIELFSSIPVIFLPCLNPWGFVHNSRNDEGGIDLNRIWDNHHHPLLSRIMERIEGQSFLLSINLHEDYDANGIYLYEPEVPCINDSLAQSILGAGESILPIDSRSFIDGRRATKGIIRPSAKEVKEGGLPEALYLITKHGQRNFTIETPSEESIEKRIDSQIRMLQKATTFLSA
jgi:protein MpaA